MMTKTRRYEFTIRCPEDVAFALMVDLERLEARYRDTYPVSVESVSLKSFTFVDDIGEWDDRDVLGRTSLL